MLFKQIKNNCNVNLITDLISYEINYKDVQDIVYDNLNDINAAGMQPKTG